MASTQTLCTSFLQQILVATHDFSVAGDVFKVALYTSSATMNSSTTVYAATNEITGTNYTAGGAALTNIVPTTSGTTAYCDFVDLAWANLTATGIRYALIYNSSKANKAVAVLDFGTDKAATAQTFTIVFPTADATNAIIRITEN